MEGIDCSSRLKSTTPLASYYTKNYVSSSHAWHTDNISDSKTGAVLAPTNQQLSKSKSATMNEEWVFFAEMAGRKSFVF